MAFLKGVKEKLSDNIFNICELISYWRKELEMVGGSSWLIVPVLFIWSFLNFST